MDLDSCGADDGHSESVLGVTVVACVVRQLQAVRDLGFGKFYRVGLKVDSDLGLPQSLCKK